MIFKSLIAAAALMLAAGVSVHANDWPNRPIKLVMQPKMPYDTQKDLLPIAQIAARRV